jgi:hypothetical protein
MTLYTVFGHYLATILATIFRRNFDGTPFGGRRSLVSGLGSKVEDLRLVTRDPRLVTHLSSPFTLDGLVKSRKTAISALQHADIIGPVFKKTTFYESITLHPSHFGRRPRPLRDFQFASGKA